MTVQPSPSHGRRSWCAIGPALGRRVALAAVLAATAAIAPSAASAAPAPKLSWQPCASPAAQGFDCATVRVPLNHRHPRRSKIRLAVIRHRATDPARRVGTLFFNPGGPGVSKAEFPAVYDFFPAPLRARFDIVTWDPRGIGESTAVQCFASQQAEERFLDGVGEPTESFPVGKAEKVEWIQRYRRFGSRCERRNGNLLRHLSTAAIARDMNLLRRAAGAGRLNYWGISYGSFLGATYANLFPKRVRAMIVDGTINPRAWVRRQRKANGGAFLGTWLRLRSDEGAAKTLDAFLRLCGDADPADCAFSAGSPAATQDKFAALLRRLRRDPETAEPTYAELVSQTAGILYSVGSWAVLAQWLQDAWTNGSSSRPLAPSSLPPGTPARRSSASAGQRYAGIEQALAIFCSESPNPRPAAFWGLDSFAEARSGAVGPFWSWASQPCASWPAKAAARYAGPWNRRTANPLLVIGNTHDPATPYRGARTMARLLARARLLTVDGYGHTALTNPSACANAHASRYLIQGALPRTGTRCEQDQAPFGGR